MTAFGPWVGKQDKNPRDARVRQNGKKESGVITEYSNIGKIALVHIGQQARHAIEVGLTTDDPGWAAGKPVKITRCRDVLKYPSLISGIIGRYS